jgi:2-polyprenyl-3-methyl-5-hydroxy-6-metoxy-1,4-benzoquinol methylase
VVTVGAGIASYDDKYRRSHYFRYRQWLYRPFIKALIKKANLRAGCDVLDVGCGQGFFSSLFADFGLKAVGVDISPEGIRSAERDYSFSGAKFEVGDVLSLECEGAYDCVFARGLSVYNSNDFEGTRDITDVLLAYLKPGGVMIFDYYTNLCRRRKSQSWIYHSLADAKKHFSLYPGATVYFSLRIETLLFGSWALSFPFTLLAAFISRSGGIGGELIAFVPRCSPDPDRDPSGLRAKNRDRYSRS